MTGPEALAAWEAAAAKLKAGDLDGAEALIPTLLSSDQALMRHKIVEARLAARLKRD